MLKGARTNQVKDFQETHFSADGGKYERNLTAYFLNQKNDLTKAQKKEAMEVWNLQVSNEREV